MATISGGSGNDSLTGSQDDDSITGNAGNDTLVGYSGNDTISGDAGNDTIYGGQTADPTYTTVSNGQTINGTTGQDYFRWAAENSSNATIRLDDGGGSDNDGDNVADYVLVGTTNTTNTLALRGFDYGKDKIVLQEDYTNISSSIVQHSPTTYGVIYTITYANGNTQIFNIELNGTGPIEPVQIFTTTPPVLSDDDVLSGGDDADTFVVEDNFGNDTITGGEGGTDFDTIDLSAVTSPVTVTYSGSETGTVTDGTGTITFSQIERFILTDLADTVDGSADSIGINIEARGGDDFVLGGTGNDTLLGEDGNDTLSGEAGDDSIAGGAGDDFIDGGDGNDNLNGGTGNDVLIGGDGTDTFVYAPGDGNDTITDFNVGNTGTLDDGNNANNDFIDLSAFYGNIRELHADQADDGILNQSNDGVDGVDYSGRSSFGTGSLNFSGASADNSSFTSENTGVVCFTTGTAICTPRGDVLIEDLVIGDLVITADNGPQPIRWIGKRRLGQETLRAAPNLRPVLFHADVLGNARPLLVSPQHCMLVGKDQLMRAKNLVGQLPGVRIANGKRAVTYIHLMFDAHQIIFAENAPSESFYPGNMSLRMMGSDLSMELLALFPELRDNQNLIAPTTLWYGETVRPVLKQQHLDAACPA